MKEKLLSHSAMCFLVCTAVPTDTHYTFLFGLVKVKIPCNNSHFITIPFDFLQFLCVLLYD